MSQETKVGMFLLLAISAILSGIVFLGDVNIFERRHRYGIDFANVEALPPKAAVKISGVEVGKVLKVSLVEGRARVLVAIEPEVTIYNNASARIGSTGIIGTRFVDLNPGTTDAGELPRNSVIPGGSSVGLDQLIGKISALFEEDNKYGSATENLKAVFANLRHVTDSLNSAIGERPEDIGQIVTNIKALSENAKKFSQDLEEISSSRKEDLKVALGKFRDISEKLDDIMTKIQNGEGTIGTLVSDKKTAEDVKSAVVSIRETANSAQELLGRVNRINTYWNYRNRYDFKDEEFRSDAGITFVPRPGKYYSIGVTNIGDMPANEDKTQFERKNRIVATVGADWGPFTGYVGAIRSAGGLGLNFRPLWMVKNWEKRVELQAEATDFSRDRVVNGKHLDTPFIDVGAHLALTRWLWVGVREEDLSGRPSFQTSANVVLLDKDLAYLLGLASLARP